MTLWLYKLLTTTLTRATEQDISLASCTHLKETTQVAYGEESMK